MADVDATSFSQPVDAYCAVVKNIRHLSQDQRERVLLAAAVLYGIIRPEEPSPRRYPCVDCGKLVEDTYGGMCLACFRTEGALEKAQLSSDATPDQGVAQDTRILDKKSVPEEVKT